MKKLLAILVACLMPICLIAGSGDVNGDGRVDVADIVELLNHLNGNPTKNYQATEADANNDGVVDKNDVKAIADKILTVKINGTISLPDGIDNSFLKSCKIVGLNQNYEIDGNTFQIYTNPNGAVQTFFLTDDEKTYMACRLEQIENGQQITIDAETSAMALATLHPLFAPCKGSDYYDIYWKLRSSSRYLEYYQEVENAIKANRDIFDDSNEALINSLNILYNSVLYNIDFDAYKNASAISLSRNTTRGAYQSTAIYQSYFIADTTRNALTLQCRGLTPSYYGTVKSALTGEVRNYAVTSRSDYGLLEYWLKPNDQRNLGKKCTFTFKTEGEHYISLSRTNAAATVDFYMHLAKSVLSMIGIKFGDDNVVQEISSIIADAMLAAGMNVALSANGNNPEFMDWFGIAYKATVDYLKRNTNTLAKKALFSNVRNIAGILSNSFNIYGKIKGSANIGARIAYALEAPEKLEFCLCYYKGNLYDCVEAYLSKKSGDNQKGKPNEALSEPIRVSVQTMDKYGKGCGPSPFHNVRFYNIEGGGFVESEYVPINNNGTAETYWTLGSSGDQKVEAVVWDLINDCAVSEYVTFEADLDREINVVTISGNSIDENSAIFSGRVEYYNSDRDKGDVGFFYNTTGSPSSGNGQNLIAGKISEYESFDSFLTGLEEEKTYYIRAYYYSNGKYIYGEQCSFTTMKHGVYTSCPDDKHPHWIDLGLPSGTLWRCCNVGASKPEDYGGYYNNKLAPYVPTYDQWEELKESGDWNHTMTTQNGVDGLLCMGNNGGRLFLPGAGDYWEDGHYWNKGCCIYLISDIDVVTSIPYGFGLVWGYMPGGSLCSFRPARKK